MIWRFDSFELDEERRELRLRGREVIVEPLVFDLLVELVRNHERVVTKDELLDRIWPGAIVTKGSLQRAVSLARSALRSGGLADAIRTFPRRGYRFDAGVTEDTLDPKQTLVPDDLGAITRARQAFEHDEWSTALVEFSAADRQGGLGGADLERTAWCQLNLGNPHESILWLERAATAHSVAADALGAARAALLLCQVHFEGRRLTVAGGWQQRAMRLLAGSAPCRELAQFEWVTGRLALAQGNPDLALVHGERALEMARSIEDPDLEAVSLIYLGHVCVARGEVRRGLLLHDEAAAAVLGGPVAPWFAGLVYCGLVYICQNRGDWSRAAQWTDAFGRWSDRSPTTIFPAVCRLHRAEVLALRGELVTAERELIEVRSELEHSAPWAVGDAERLYGEVLRGGAISPALSRPIGAHRWLVGTRVRAGPNCLSSARTRPRQFAPWNVPLPDPSWPCRQRRRLLLTALARAAALSGDTTRAREALDAAMSSEDGDITPAQQGALERARAELAAAEGRGEEATRLLRVALRFWRDIGATLEIAPLHERLAEVLQALGDREAAALELMTAETLWREAGSLARAEACAAKRVSA